MSRSVTHALLAVALLALGATRPSPLPAQGAADLAELVQGLGVSARVLVIAAHPDDEDTRLIAWLARGRHVETAYLSLTRGDGGQNLIGNELGEALGVIRTEELLAARRIDGARQFFTRAYDFGFSKSAEETFQHWPRDSVLGDVVTVVRAFRPHVIVAIFSGTPDDGHGHHQVSGILAREAYDVSADTVRFPAAKYGAAWAVPKFYRGTSYRANRGATYLYNAGEYSPLRGRSYAEIAGESRSQHKSQGFGSLERKGAIVGSVRREATRVNEGTPAERETSIFEGVDTTWARFRQSASSAEARAAIESLPATIAAVRQSLDIYDPGATVVPLTRVKALLDRVGVGTAGPRRLDLERSWEVAQSRIARALLTAAGVAIEVTAERASVAQTSPRVYGGMAGSLDSVRVDVALYNRGRERVALQSVWFPVSGQGSNWLHERVIPPDSSFRGGQYILFTSLSRPWWLVRERRGDLFAVPIDTLSEDRRSVGEDAQVTLSVAGTRVKVPVPVVNRFADPVRGEIQRPLAVVPGIVLTLDRNIEYAPANAAYNRPLRVTLTSAFTTPRDVRVSLRLPRGLSADSAERVAALPAGGTQSITFYVRGRLSPGRDTIRAVATSGGETFTAGYTPIEYEHIRPQRLYHEAAVAIQAVDVKLPAKLNVAYVPGVGDNIPPMLQQLGVPVTVVEASALGATDLSRFTSVVVGPRAFESHPELANQNARLLAFARAGGTLVMQYQQYEITRPGVAPYPMTLGRPAERVTLENAPVEILAPSAPLLTYPNRIGQADFQGWVQERATYMPSTFDPKYTPLLGMKDPEMPQPNRGALLVAPYGRGVYVYTTLVFFRELPAGVPGAARLFVNLLSTQPIGDNGEPVVP
ncbi:MAG TPA: PIG-L family deacetylase [Gemmatimonadaceae bacterium]|nr:PIG-L family deacetylase [Gemmatimonadaceae bacterium]